MGEVDESVLARFDLTAKQVSFFELDLDALLPALPESDRQYSFISRYPAATRDLALVLPFHVSAAAVQAIIARHRLVERAELFDLYTGGNVPAGAKSLAFRVYFQAPDRTLTNAEVDRSLQGSWATWSERPRQRCGPRPRPRRQANAAAPVPGGQSQRNAMTTRVSHHAGSHEHGHRHVEQDMLSVEQAYQRIMAGFRPLEPEETPLLEALGRVLAADVRSPLDLPPTANSGMDGYALRWEDIQDASPETPRVLSVIGVVAAGQVPSQTVTPGKAVRIMTGASLPDGADTVAPFEETDEVQRKAAGQPLAEVAVMASLPDGADTVAPFEETDEVQRKAAGQPLAEVAVMAALPPGCNVRPEGEDVRRGQLVLESGTVVRAAEVGVLASLGMETAPVVRRPVVAVLATGDELTPPGRPLAAGKIYDSNSFSTAASVIRCGGTPKMLGIAPDNMADLHAKLEAASEADLIVTSAGVSRGDYDIVKEALTQRGEMNFWSVRMRPAKPLAFGHVRGSGGNPVPLLGLPGNPVSAMVAFEMFARPAILTMLGRTRLPRPAVEGVLTAPIFNADGRRVYARVEVERRNGSYYATPCGPQGSNILTSMSRANGLAICPENLSTKRAGERVDIIMLDWNEEVEV